MQLVDYQKKIHDLNDTIKTLENQISDAVLIKNKKLHNFFLNCNNKIIN